MLVACLSARAQLTGYDPLGARSISGQFVIHVETPNPHARAPDFSDAPGMLKLEASLLAVSCERIKAALMGELGDKSQWRGRIFLSLRPAQTPEDEITFTTERFKDSWAYRLDVPNPLPRTRLVRAVVRALLQERANRNARERSANIPLWLSEGLTEIVMASRSLELILPPPKWGVNRLVLDPMIVESRRTNALTLARLGVGDRGPMSLEELSWPKEDQLAGPDAAAFSHSAQMFVGELLRFRDGRDCFRAMLDALPDFLNWQTAFLRAFRPHFERQIDLEKWWALQMVNFTGRDSAGLWTVSESWNKLDDLLPVQTQVRRERNELPVPAQVPLTTVIREWDVVRQTRALPAKLNELYLARQRVAEEFLPLVDDYRHVLQDYLARCGRAGVFLPLGSRRTHAKALVRETVAQLEALEERRRALRPAGPVSAAQTTSPLAAQP